MIFKEGILRSLAIEIEIEKLYHQEKLQQLKRDEDKKIENIRSEKALESIKKRYKDKLEAYEELGIFRER